MSCKYCFRRRNCTDGSFFVLVVDSISGWCAAAPAGNWDRSHGGGRAGTRYSIAEAVRSDSRSLCSEVWWKKKKPMQWRRPESKSASPVGKLEALSSLSGVETKRQPILWAFRRGLSVAQRGCCSVCSACLGSDFERAVAARVVEISH